MDTSWKMFRSKPSSASELPPGDIVARAWRQVLDRRTLDADMPFDQAGGDSLRLLKLAFLMEEQCGLRLPMDVYHVGMRPSEFAVVLQLGRRLGDKAPAEPPGTVFLVPGMGGESLLEGGFRAACSPHLHVAIVDLPDWPELAKPLFTLEHIIEQAATEITLRQPEGPVRLLGYSLG